MKIIAFCLCLWAFVASTFGECVQDYECGNIPYTVCNGGVNECATTVNGLGIDLPTNLIYFAQVCRTDVFLSNITIKSLNPSGGIPTPIQTRVQVNAAANPGYFFDVVDNNLYYSIQARAPGQLLTRLDLATLVQSETIDTGAFFQNAIEFDTANRLTFVCNLVLNNTVRNYTIDRFDGILGEGALQRKTLYTLPFETSCTAVRKQGNDLYFTTLEYAFNSSDTTATFYKGSSDCVDCDVSPLFLFSLAAERINDFDVTTDRIYYGTSIGLFSSTFSGSDVVHISWSAGATAVRILGNRVYWNSGVAILSASLDGSDVKQVNQFSGSCGCRKGFIGTTCTTCPGQVQWLSGAPSCVAFGDNGYPVTCNFDYECINSPYSFCAGTCQCRTGLAGTSCNQCTNTTQSLVWVDGFPSCQ